MGVEFDFPQGVVPSDVAGWARAGRRARTTASPGSVTPTELAGSTTDLIDTTAQNAAAAAASAAEATAIATATSSAATLAANAQATAISTASAALAAHVSAIDPHPVYLTQTEADARYLLLNPTLSLQNAVDDAAAAALGVGVGKLYRDGSVVKIRVA